MARSFLAAFRSTDAHSLARALILLLVLSATFDAFHAGSMAAADGPAGAICGSSGASTAALGDPSDIPQGGGWSCCILGCANIPTGLIGTTEILSPAAIWARSISQRLRASSAVAAFDRPGNIGPRGPPSLT